MRYTCNDNGFALYNGEELLLQSTAAHPMIYVGTGREDVLMYRGNFKIEDYLTARRPLQVTAVEETPDSLLLIFGTELEVLVRVKGSLATLEPKAKNPEINRFWLRVNADKAEHCYGCGEQMSYFDLRGRHFPLWSSEPGVGRSPESEVAYQYNKESMGIGGGTYYTTNYPQPTYVSSKRYYLHVDSTAYADFDFRNETFHELQIWEVPRLVRIEAADTFPALLEKETAYFGRQPELPDWIYNGLIVGAQGGTQRSLDIMEKTIANDVPVSALWCQDWCGKRVTSFGKRLQWDWHFHPEMYPDLPATIAKLHSRGIKFFGYINPYLVNDGELYAEGKKLDVFAKKADGSEYLVDFGEFYCGVIDLTKPAAYEWFKDKVIKKYTLDIGIDGWMADFGEYLPTDDIVLDDGVSAMVEHNRWPVRWAQCNYDAVKESGKLGQVVYFMRAGGAGSQKYATLLWAGDQSVDFSRHDGLVTVICAALSAGMMGCGLSHCDIGGYTSLFDNLRTKEVFLRWAEMAAFSPVMRTHEGNRPDTNFQYYDDEDCMRRLSRLVKVYKALSPYIKATVAENAASGIPVQRPLFMHYDSDERAYTEQFEYLLGRDILVAPVWQADKTEWSCYLPDDEWVHLWSGAEYGAGEHTVKAPLGDTPVFYRKNSPNAKLFAEIGEKYAQ